MKSSDAVDELVVDGLHALRRERTGVLALLLAPLAEARVLAGRLRVAVAMHFNTPRGPNFALNVGSFG